MSVFNKNKEYSAKQVFVPGGFPELTYNPRTDLELEERLEDAKDYLCKLVMMTGSTKSGKSVLTNQVFPRNKCVWFDGGSFSLESDFWIDVLTQLEIFPDQSENEDKSSTYTGTVKGGIEKQLLLFKLKGEAGASASAKEGSVNGQSRKGNPKTVAIQALRELKRPLIIDDFHYLPRENQALIVRAVKALIFEGLPVIFIAIPHRRLDAVKVEREMTGRIENIEIPSWNENELLEIPYKGFPLLNVELSESIANRFASESIGSPHLMQEFCREICRVKDVKRTTKEKVHIDNVNFEKLFQSVALNTGKVIFDKLSKGPRQRTDRMQRKLTTGITTDIYGLILYALAELKPGLETIDYEALRSKIKDISIDNQPQAHEVSRVLDKMSQIAASDESSTPVIDWEKEERLLHVTDPFFAYYLRWGLQIFSTNESNIGYRK